MTVQVESNDAPEGLVDYYLEFPSPPADFQMEEFGPRDKAAVERLFLERTCIDPISNREFTAWEFRDFFRFGFTSTNINVNIGKRKPMSGSGFELDAGLLCPTIAPGSFFAPADYADNKHAMNFFVLTRSNERSPTKLPKYLADWHKEDVQELRDKFGACKEYFQQQGPNVDKDWNIFKGNRHWREAQRAHRLSALTYQLLDQMDKLKAVPSSRELNAWCTILGLEMIYAQEEGREVDRNLAVFVTHRMEDIIKVDTYGDVGYQNFRSRYVFIKFWLGEAEPAWDAACEISKLRGSEFTKSPMYDAIIEMRNDPKMIADLFSQKPAECLTYFRI